MGVVTRAQAKRMKSQQSHSQEPPPRRGGGGGGPDLISLLPDEVLGSVISLLPTEEGARTQILSSRWRHIWHAAPLNLEVSGRSMREDVVSRILSEHHGVARRFCLSHFFLPELSASLDGWLRSPALDSLQELDFGFNPLSSPRPLMPHSALRFSSTLRVAKFGCCRFPDAAAHQVHFPNLQHLALHSVTISEDSLHAMLASCPALNSFVLMYYFDASPRPPMPLSALGFSSTLRIAEFGSCQFPDVAAHQVHFPNLQHLALEVVIISEDSLHSVISGSPSLNSLMMNYSSGFRQFRITFLNLKRVEMYFRRSNTIRLQDLIVVNAPFLERLHHRGPYEDKMHISIISAPKLKILGRLTDNISRLELGSTVFRGLHVARMATMMRTLKVLALRHDNLSFDVIINFMKCFPCLEKLYIKTYSIVIGNMQIYNSQERIEWLDLHLKKLRISYYHGNRSHVDFAKFFVLNTCMLESMVLNVEPGKMGNDKWIENQRRRLQLEKRASIGAQFDFTFDDCFHYLTDIHEYSDPCEYIY